MTRQTTSLKYVILFLVVCNLFCFLVVCNLCGKITYICHACI
uniref:Uncharacterized protein n=1 Tax=Arundo donax TaxID=35708 RepID=A0A0A9EI58_ARUDO